jgi:hypothetical protein
VGARVGDKDIPSASEGGAGPEEEPDPAGDPAADPLLAGKSIVSVD